MTLSKLYRFQDSAKDGYRMGFDHKDIYFH